MTTEVKRVYTLYRVSTLGQVEKDDIPMQKQTCHEFADAQGWEIVKEFSEKGISGFKVSAKDRDAIQEIQRDALNKKFDILLVFMFDRIGRREDETPFVVEWFVNAGVEVWSAKEGQQRFDTHVDKLTNYIRFWQASGESIKTSIRTKTRLSQIVQEGRYRGGGVPYGYRLEKQGRFNSKNHEVYELVIDENEAAIVRQIFDLYLTRGYGSLRIANYLTSHGIQTRKGSNFTNATIQHMLKNITYTGVLRSGETLSEVFPELQIIEVRYFERVQEMLQMRSREYNEKRRIPLNTRGSTLLAGNVFCGHCGARLTTTTCGKEYVDGNATPKIRYVCYNKTRHKHLCDGQTGYTAKILDKMIEQVIRNIFANIKEQPKEKMINTGYQKSIEECTENLSRAKAELNSHLAEQTEYEAEVIKAIRGTSQFSPELINKLANEANQEVIKYKALVEQYESELSACKQNYSSFHDDYEEILTWTKIYEVSSIETKKMIVARLINNVRVSRDYRLEIDLNVTCEQLGIAASTKVANAGEYWL